MKDQIKIQVSDDGLFGRDATDMPERFIDGYVQKATSPQYIQWLEDTVELPLTTPQIPKSVVMGELVWQKYHFYISGDWYDVSEPEVKEDTHRQAYKVINTEPKETATQETCNRCRFPYESSDHRQNCLDNHLNQPNNIDKMVDEVVSTSKELKDNFVKVWGFETNIAEIARTAIEVGIRWQKKQENVALPISKDMAEACNNFQKKHDFRKSGLTEFDFFDAGANWQAQQQPVSKSEENMIDAETLIETFMTFKIAYPKNQKEKFVNVGVEACIRHLDSIIPKKF